VKVLLLQGCHEDVKSCRESVVAGNVFWRTKTYWNV